MVSQVTGRQLWRLYKAARWVNSLLPGVCVFIQERPFCVSAGWGRFSITIPLGCVIYGRRSGEVAQGDARPDELTECWSDGGSWGCKWGCEDQRVSLSADFTCLFNQRPRQEASPHRSAVPMATPLLIVAHPLADSFQQRGEVETFEWWRRERRSRVCVFVFPLTGLKKTALGWSWNEALIMDSHQETKKNKEMGQMTSVKPTVAVSKHIPLMHFHFKHQNET